MLELTAWLLLAYDSFPPQEVVWRAICRSFQRQSSHYMCGLRTFFCIISTQSAGFMSDGRLLCRVCHTFRQTIYRLLHTLNGQLMERPNECVFQFQIGRLENMEQWCVIASTSITLTSRTTCEVCSPLWN